MTILLDRALEIARKLPAGAQDDIARVVLSLAGDDEARVVLSPGERDAIAISKAAAACGDFASDAEVQAVWAKYGL